MFGRKQNPFVFVVAGVCALCFADMAWPAAGAVVSVWGQAAVQRDGQSVRLVNDSAIESGDVLSTGADGYLYVRMENAEEIYLRPNSRFEIEEFAAPASPDRPETGRSFYRLFSGAFRAVTRSLGRRDKDSYRVTTLAATMGVRGTAYMIAIDAQGRIFFGVEEGSIEISNANGTLVLDAGEYAMVEGLQFAPQPLSSRPEILAGNWTPPPAGGGLAGGPATTGATAATAVAAGAAAALMGVTISVLGEDDDGGGTSATTDTGE